MAQVGRGGGIYSFDLSNVTVSASSVRLNAAKLDGGGIFGIGNTITVRNGSTISENKAGSVSARASHPSTLVARTNGPCVLCRMAAAYTL